MKNEFTGDYKQLGLKISYFRKLRGFTQEQLAEQVDIDPNHLSKAELGKSGISLDVLFALSKALKVPTSKFFEVEDLA